MSWDALNILTRHVLITHPRSGQAACAEEGCEWEMRTGPWKYRPIPSPIDRGHAIHQLELLEAIGFSDQTYTRTHSMPAPKDDSGW